MKGQLLVGVIRGGQIVIGWKGDDEFPTVFALEAYEASWLYYQLGSHLNKGNEAETIAGLRRSNAALRGALSRKRDGWSGRQKKAT